MKNACLTALLAALSCAPAAAAGLEQAKTDFLTPSLQEGLARIRAAAPRWASVSMNIYVTQNYYDISDLSNRISLRGSKASGGQFYFNGAAASQPLSLSAFPRSSQDPSRGYTLSGSWVNLSLDPIGGSMSINGWVNHRSIWLQASRRAGGGFNLWGQTGMNVSVMGSGKNLWVTGSVDLDQFDESSLAALGAALSVLDSLPPKLTASIDGNDLLDLLRDRDPEVRKEALKTARFQQGINTDVRARVFDMARDTREDAGVRREAVRTLFWVVNLSETRDALLELARHDRAVPVREMAYKALYQSAATFSDIRDAVREAARGEREPAVRRAALWALFDSTGDSEVRDTLQEVAQSRHEGAAARAEAVKSLFLAMNRSEVSDLVLDLAKDRSQDEGLRVTAIYALYDAKHQGEVADALRDMSRGSDPVIRAAAVKASGSDDLFMRAYFHLGTRVNGHLYVSPIENE